MISTPISGSFVGGSVSLTGTATDDKGVKAVRIEVPTVSGTATYPTTLNTTTNQWTATIATKNVSGSIIADGQTIFTVIASDTSGKESTNTVVLNVDNTAPTVLVNVPQGYGALKLPSTSDFLEIKGDVFDKSPLTKVEASILDGTGTVLSTVTASGTNTFSARLIFASLKDASNNPVTLTDLATYSYKVTAYDKVGNTNSYYYHAQDIWPILGPSDLFPASDDLGKADQDGTALPTGQTAAAVRALRIDGTGPTCGPISRLTSTPANPASILPRWTRPNRPTRMCWAPNRP